MIDVSYLGTDPFQRLCPVGLHQSFDKKFLALQGAHHRTLQFAPQRSRQTDQKGVWQIDDMRQGFSTNSLQKFLELPAENAGFALQHGEREFTEHLRII